MEDIIVLIVAFVMLAVVLVIGFLEKKRNQKNIEQFEIRVNVNGIRGKSTATRLITAILWEAGYKAIGKTTGTAARMMFWDTPDEMEVKRKPRGVSIGEQAQIINKAAKYGANALVCECMAVNPEYQKVYQHQIIQANLTVIVNVLRDHIDDMGPTTEQIAWAFADTIPYNGKVVIPQCDYTEFFKKVAAKRNSEVFVAKDALVSQEYIDMFDYKLFDHNIAIALAAAEALGIDRETACRGMLKAHPDPGALRTYNLDCGKGGYVLVNGFAANEPSSSLELWEKVRDEIPEAEYPVVLMNCRPDRVDRTKQFVVDFFPKIENSVLVCVGQNTREVTKAYNAGKFKNVIEYINYEGVSVEKVVAELEEMLPGKCLLCVGNIHGDGEPILDTLLLNGGMSVEHTMAYEQQRSANFAKRDK